MNTTVVNLPPATGWFRVAIRPECFGGLVYRYDNRRPVFPVITGGRFVNCLMAVAHCGKPLDDFTNVSEVRHRPADTGRAI